MKTSKWNGFERVDFGFKDRDCILVFPNKENKTDKWLLKTEYFDAFPKLEIEMLKRGYHIAYMKNVTRWGMEDDYEKKFLLAKFLNEKYRLNRKCAMVGMSCGGLHAINLAAKYPDMAAVLYLDAPVVNLLSCPAYMGHPAEREGDKNMWYEFYAAKGISRSELIGLRTHPLDKIPMLLKNKIPIILVVGDSDKTVPYDENGIHIRNLYEQSDCPFEFHEKKGCDHHPHGLDDNEPIIRFIEKYYR